MKADQRHKLLAAVLVVLGSSQAVIALTEEGLMYSIFYLVFGVSLASIGGVSLWMELYAAEQ